MQYSSYYEGSTAAIHAKHALFDHFSIFLLLSSSSFYIKICMKHDTKFLHIMSFSRQEMIRGRGVRSVYFTTGSYFITGSSLVLCNRLHRTSLSPILLALHFCQMPTKPSSVFMKSFIVELPNPQRSCEMARFSLPHKRMPRRSLAMADWVVSALLSVVSPTSSHPHN